MATNKNVEDFESHGFSTAGDSKGNLESFNVFLEKIFFGYITGPEETKQMPSNYVKYYEHEVNHLKDKIADCDKKITHYRSLQEEFRIKKDKIRDEIKNEQKSTSDYSPTRRLLIIAATIILIIGVFFIYGWMMIHINSENPSSVLLPNADIILSEVGRNWITLFWGIVPVLLCFFLELTFSTDVSKKRKMLIPLLIGIVLGLDYFIASAVHNRHNELNVLLGLPQINIFSDMNFWIVLALGPVTAFILSFAIYFTKKSSPREHHLKKSNFENLKEEERKLREKEMAFKEDWRKIENEKDIIIGTIRDIERRINSTFISKDKLLERISDFYSGWVRWMVQSFGENSDELYSKLQIFRKSYEDTKVRIDRSFIEITENQNHVDK